MIWPGWHKVSVRKPLAVFSAFWGAAICTAAYGLDRDLPPGVVSVMVAIIPTCIGSYAASSAYETVRTPKEEKDEAEEKTEESTYSPDGEGYYVPKVPPPPPDDS